MLRVPKLSGPGSGNSPPGRSVEGRPLVTVTVGSARIFNSDSSCSAVRNAVKTLLSPMIPKEPVAFLIVLAAVVTAGVVAGVLNGAAMSATLVIEPGELLTNPLRLR